jgi:tRNA-uridine 2-sulfurtransferase
MKYKFSIKPKKIFVALSGGVDSAMAAALLQDMGHQVSGAYIKTHSVFQEDVSDSQKKAETVASALGIPFYVFDFRESFKKIVIDPFLEKIEQGLTPNPCVDCNPRIKFELFWDRAKEMGAELMATGHYVRLVKARGTLEIHCGKDKSKDQSYFLWQLNQSHLARTLFPLGNYRKNKIIRMAAKRGLPVSDSEESMEVCFIPEKNSDFLKENLSFSGGNIIDDRGDKIGEHQGLPLYTIGQRKGIGLPGGPYYVYGRDFSRNVLLVTLNDSLIWQKKVWCQKAEWVSGNLPEFPVTVQAKIRYRQDKSKAKLSQLNKDTYCLDFKKAQRAVTPGQSVAFYQGSRLIGGGVIIDSED